MGSREIPIDGNEISHLLAAKRRGRGVPLPARLRMVALRLDAGMRETPQRFLPVAAYVGRLDIARRRFFLRYLLEEALREAAALADCPAAVWDLLVAANETLSLPDAQRQRARDALVGRILDAAPPLRRRRHIHCHGSVASDRRLLMLRSLLPREEEATFAFLQLWHTIAYAMADYERDHFVMKGAHVADRVRRLADWTERSMADVARIGVGSEA